MHDTGHLLIISLVYHTICLSLLFMYSNLEFCHDQWLKQWVMQRLFLSIVLASSWCLHHRITCLHWLSWVVQTSFLPFCPGTVSLDDGVHAIKSPASADCLGWCGHRFFPTTLVLFPWTMLYTLLNHLPLLSVWSNVNVVSSLLPWCYFPGQWHICHWTTCLHCLSGAM